MTTATISYGTSTAMTLTLPASGAARESTAVDNTTNKFDDALVHVKFTAGTVATNKQALVWVYGSEDGTNYDGVCTGTDAAYTMRVPDSLALGAVIPTPTNSVVYQKTFSIAALFGGVMPRKWGLVFQSDGTGTPASGSFTYTGIKYDSA
jgi:hypothetical protein